MKEKDAFELKIVAPPVPKNKLTLDIHLEGEQAVLLIGILANTAIAGVCVEDLKNVAGIIQTDGFQSCPAVEVRNRNDMAKLQAWVASVLKRLNCEG